MGKSQGGDILGGGVHREGQEKGFDFGATGGGVGNNALEFVIVESRSTKT